MVKGILLFVRLDGEEFLMGCKELHPSARARDRDSENRRGRNSGPMIVLRRVNDGYGAVPCTHARGEMAVDDVEELADGIDGEFVHAVE